MEQIRCDRSRLPSVARTDEGYLRGEAIVTRIGVFPYVNADGTIRRELRHPDDVLSSESLDSLKMIPITVDHPTSMVTAENAKELSVGHTGENPRVDGRHIVAPLTITAKQGIDAVGEGRSELSLGYRLDLLEESGNYDGESYTHRQRNIRYNHLALVHQARAGRAARLNLDGVSVQCDEDQENTTMIKVNLDGIQYDAAPEVARALEKSTAEVARLTSELATATANADAAKGELATTKTKLEATTAELATEKGKRSDQAAIAKAVQARVKLESDAARFVKLDKASEMSDKDIQVAAIKAHHKDVNLDGKSDEHIAIYFDAMLNLAPPQKQSDIVTGGRAAYVSTSHGDAQKAEDEAYKKSINNLNSWRTQKTS